MISVSGLIRDRCMTLPSFGISAFLPVSHLMGARGIAVSTNDRAVVELLSRQRWIHNLWLSGWKLDNVSSVQTMHWLQGLYLAVPQARAMNFDSFGELDSLAIEFSDAGFTYRGFDGLSSLFVGGYDSDDCARLNKIKLKQCCLGGLSLKRLDGLCTFDLVEAGFKGCRNLSDLHDMARRATHCGRLWSPQRNLRRRSLRPI